MSSYSATELLFWVFSQSLDVSTQQKPTLTATKQTAWCDKVAPPSLTFTRATPLLIPPAAEASTNRNQPFPVGAAIHLRLLSLLWLVDTRASDLHQRGGVSPSDRVRKGGQVADSERAGFVEDADGNQRDAGAHVLKRQVEALPGRDPDVTHFGVQFHDAVADVHLCGRLQESQWKRWIKQSTFIYVMCLFKRLWQLLLIFRLFFFPDCHPDQFLKWSPIK